MRYLVGLAAAIEAATGGLLRIPVMAAGCI
jgi:hypothetical protein